MKTEFKGMVGSYLPLRKWEKLTYEIITIICLIIIFIGYILDNGFVMLNAMGLIGLNYAFFHFQYYRMLIHRKSGKPIMYKSHHTIRISEESFSIVGLHENIKWENVDRIIEYYVWFNHWTIAIAYTVDDKSYEARIARLYYFGKNKLASKNENAPESLKLIEYQEVLKFLQGKSKYALDDNI